MAVGGFGRWKWLRGLARQIQTQAQIQICDRRQRQQKSTSLTVTFQSCCGSCLSTFSAFCSASCWSWPHSRLHIALVFRSRILFNPDKNIISIKNPHTHSASELWQHPGRSSIRRVGHPTEPQTSRNGPEADVFNFSIIYFPIPEVENIQQLERIHIYLYLHIILYLILLLATLNAANVFLSLKMYYKAEGTSKNLGIVHGFITQT